MDEFDKPIEAKVVRSAKVVRNVRDEIIPSEIIFQYQGEPLGIYREWKAQLETIKRTLARAEARDDYDARRTVRLEKQKQHLEEQIAEVDRIREAQQSSANARPRAFTNTRTLPSEPFTHSPDYISVRIHDVAYTLTSKQAQMIQILHKAHESGHPDVRFETILEEFGTLNSRWQDTWKTNKKARKTLIKSGQRRGTLRLNL